MRFFFKESIFKVKNKTLNKKSLEKHQKLLNCIRQVIKFFKTDKLCFKGVSFLLFLENILA